MLYCNDELVRLKDDEWKYLEPKFQEIRKMRAPIRILTNQKITLNETGHVEHIPPHSWPLQGTIINDKGESETWRYTKNTPKMEKDRLVFSQNAVLIQHGSLAIDPIKETDFAYFMIYLSGILNSGLYKLEDVEQEATKEVEKIGSNSAVEFYLCNKYSPLYNDEKNIRRLAASWGIPNSQTEYLDTVRKQLVDKVNSSQRNYSVTKRGIDEFVEEMNGGDVFSEYRQSIQIAIDQKVIGWNDKDKMWYWLDTSNGNYVDPIMTVPPTQVARKTSLLFEFMKMNSGLFATLKKAIDLDSPINFYSHLEWKALQKLASSRGVNAKGRTRELIEQDLIMQDSDGIPSEIN